MTKSNRITALILSGCLLLNVPVMASGGARRKETGFTSNRIKGTFEVDMHDDISGTWINDTCKIVINGAEINTEYVDESGQVHHVISHAQFTNEGNWFYTLNRDGHSKMFSFEYELEGDQLHIFAEGIYSDYVDGILGRGTDEYFTKVPSGTRFDAVTDAGVNSINNGTKNGSGYLLPESSSKYLTEADIAGFSLQELNYARNEIAAKHGRKFNSAELTQYFSTFAWYNPTLDPEEYGNRIEDLLNEYEIRNADWLMDQEKNPSHPDGYALDQPGYDITNVRSFSGNNASTDYMDTTLKTAELSMYGLYQKNQGIVSTGYSTLEEIRTSSYVFLDHYGQFTYDQNLDNGTWFFDFDHDGEDEMLVWAEDDYYCYHWRLFDRRDGMVYLIAEDCGNKPGNAGHSLDITSNGAIHDRSTKGVGNYTTSWDGYIYFMEGEVHYLYGYTSYQFVREGEQENMVLEEAAFALDGQYIDENTYTGVVTGLGG